MITCHQLSVILSEFIDGELTENVCAEVREHIALCPECRREHGAYVKLMTLFHCHCSLKITEQTHEEIMQIIWQEVKEEPQLKSLRKKRSKK
jgi:anti-sigma factor RsiW